MPAVNPLEAEIQDALDAMVTFAMSEMGPSSPLGAAGLVQAYGQDIPENYNGAGTTMLFFADMNGQNTVEPRTQGRHRAGYGQRTETYAVEGVLLIGARTMSLPALFKAGYPWVRRVFNCFWKHIQLGGIVQEMRPKSWSYSGNEKWGDYTFFAIHFHWDVEVIVTTPTAGL